MRTLCYFYHRLLDFRLSDVEGVAATHGLSAAISWERPFGGHGDSPFWYLNVPDEEAAVKIAERAVLAKGLYELWGEGDTWEDLVASFKDCPEERKLPYFSKDVTFKVTAESYGKTFTHEEVLNLIWDLGDYLPFEAGGQAGVFPEDIVPPRWYFGRQIAVTNRSILHRYDLKDRAYIGTTSMDPELAHLMCNLCKVRPGSLVYDPFVGTGGLLVAAAHYGAITLGVDIDIRVVREGRKLRGKQVGVYSNFHQYSLPEPVGLLRADSHRPPFRDGLVEWLDAIVCDPPYGVRESARKSEPREVWIKDRDTHITSTQPYGLGECLYDLAEFAALHLKVGGRLVYWMPSAPGLYEESEIPCHPCMKILYNCEQHLSSRYTRRLFTVEKVRPLDAAAAEAWVEQRGNAIMKIDLIPKRVFEVMHRDEDGNVKNPEWLTEKRRFRGKYI